MGLSEERGVGVCSPSYLCEAGSPLLDPDNWSLFAPIDEPITCMVFDSGGGFDTYGWVTSLAACRAYRDRYGDAIDCRNQAWRSE